MVCARCGHKPESNIPLSLAGINQPRLTIREMYLKVIYAYLSAKFSGQLTCNSH
jgi:hypothetical protein